MQTVLWRTQLCLQDKINKANKQYWILSPNGHLMPHNQSYNKFQSHSDAYLPIHKYKKSLGLNPVCMRACMCVCYARRCGVYMCADGGPRSLQCLLYEVRVSF